MARDADADGFAEFVTGRERALQRTAWLLTGDWALAEDLVQTALVRSWPRWERIRRRDNGGKRKCQALGVGGRATSDPTGRYVILTYGLLGKNCPASNGWLDHGRLVPLTPAHGPLPGAETW